MRYLYYPGCSLEGTSPAYDRSLRKVFEALGHELVELEDWNCCGATMYMSVKETVALSVSARNLALARAAGADTLVAPCSACYTTLLKTNRYLREVPLLRRQVDEALGEAGLQYDLSVQIRHPLDILVNDIGTEVIARKATRRLDGLRIAPYYGCQIVRPEPASDDRDWPVSMDELFGALGAESVYFPTRVRCCGGMLMTTFPEVGRELTREVLEPAVRNGAEAVVTTCPLCQINLEMAQGSIPLGEEGKERIPVLFFTQLLGLALGVAPEDLDLHRSLIPFGEKLREVMGAAS
jgi:heterodisulfide reductase subunit B